MNGILATPEVNAPSDYSLMRALDGRSYRIRSLAALRVACVDLSILIYAVSRTLDRCHRLSRASVPEIAQAATITGLSTQQTLGGLCVLLGGAMQQLRIARWSDVRPARMGTYTALFEDGRTTTIESPVRLEEYGQGLLDAAATRLERLQGRETRFVELEEVAPLDVPGLPSSMSSPLLVAATPLVLGVVRIIAGVAVAVLVVRAAQQLLFPEAASRARGHEASIDAIEDAYRLALDTCATLPADEQAECRSAALREMLLAVERANKAAGESTIDKIVRIVAIGVGGAVAVSVLANSVGGRRRR